MKILVTGGAGFIGSHLVDLLLEKGHKVKVIDDLSTGKRENINSNIVMNNFSIEDQNNHLDEFFKANKFDYVFHLAAQSNLRVSLKDPIKDAEVNIIGSLNILKNCIKTNVKKLIFTSSSAVYPNLLSSSYFTENTSPRPESPYGLSKLLFENHLELQNKYRNLNSVVLRLSNVYGPRQNSIGEGGVVPVFFDRLRENKDLNINGSGKQTRDFIFVMDVARALDLSMNNNLSGVYNISSGNETKIIDLAQKVRGFSKNQINIKHLKEIKEAKRSCLQNKKFRKATNWFPEYSLEKGLRKTAEYLLG